MKKYTVVLLSVLLSLVAGCATVTSDINVSAEALPEANFSQYKTYDWLDRTYGVLNDPDKTWQPPSINISGDIKFLVDRELRRRGIFSTSGTPDLAVTFFVGVDMENQELKLDEETKIEFKQNIPKAALVVALIDVASGEIVWMGLADGEVQENVKEEVVRERLDYTVREMFKLMP